MGAIRKHAPHVRWTDSEVAVLHKHYATAPRDALLEMLPGRKLRIIQCKANELGLVRYRPPARTPDEVRKVKREAMARRWAENPELMRAKSRAWHGNNRDRNNEAMREYTRRRFFWTKATKLRAPVRATPADLWKLWKEQRGLCALTGRRLDRSAQLDHKIPRARGGGDELENLQWLSPEANLAKRDLTDDEFAALCGDVMAWIGRRIAMVDALTTTRHRTAAVCQEETNHG